MTQITATYYHHMGDDITTVNAARVSFAKQSKLVCTDLIQGTYDLDKRDKKLIKYLAKHKHLSPFNHASVTFVCKAPIFVARQLVKHEYMPWNEVSRRYVSDNIEFYRPDVWRGQASDKKQGSAGEVTEIDISGPDYGDDGEEYYEYGEAPPSEFSDYQNKTALDTYETLLKGGVCEEQARMVLPQSTMTEWYWTGTLGAIAKMCNLRCKPDTQYETRLIADQISDKMGQLFPVSWEALVYGED
jgi:thymidylate synthase (FAD)